MSENKVKIVPKVWGREEWIANNELYCGKILRLKKEFQSSIHYHKNKDETFYILGGKILMFLYENRKTKEKIMREGDSVRLKPGTKHRFVGLEDSVLIEFSTHHEDNDTYRDEESRMLSEEEINKYKKKYGEK